MPKSYQIEAQKINVKLYRCIKSNMDLTKRQVVPMSLDVPRLITNISVDECVTVNLMIVFILHICIFHKKYYWLQNMV